MEPPPGSLTCVGLGDTAGAQAVSDVLEHGEVFEQDVVLEDEADRALLGLDEYIGIGVVDDHSIEGDLPVIDRSESGEAPQHGALAGAVRTEQSHDLPGGKVHLDLEVERPEVQSDPSVEGHAATCTGRLPVPNQRSRRPTSTPNETPIITMASTIASSGFVSSER